LIGAIERFEDISDRKKIEKSQRLSQLGELVASMAHEVNNPLQVIAGNLQLAMMEGEKGKDIKDRIKAAWDQIMQLREILQRVLAFSKLDKGELEKTDINKVLEVVVKLVEHQYSISSIAIRREYSDILPEIELDTKQMQQVFMNLIKNAAEAMPEGGTIVVSTSKNEESIRINITDTGVGMSKDTLERIFDPFFTTKTDGTGLGLAICYGIVKKHNGNLSYVSEIGKGTTATVLLPVAGSSDED
jgi:signal transduction histidine kinase